MKPVFHPFWEELPYSNVFVAITPDILHQLYQGMVKHLVAWLTAAFGPAEIDARCSRLPPSHNIRIFKNGLSILSRVTGQEHKDMSRILLGLIVDLQLPDGTPTTHVVRTVRALLDFLYLAQYPSHSDDTLSYLDKALKRFHASKHIFEALGIRAGFNFPKLHALAHYVSSIKLIGTTDNCNTEATERLHIDLAKNAYRSTNHKDVYPQMTKWLERREKVLRHAKFIEWRIKTADNANGPAAPTPPVTRIHIARIPNAKSITFGQLSLRHGAVDFEECLARFLLTQRYPDWTPVQVANVARDIRLPFKTVATFNQLKIRLADAQGIDDAPDIRIAIRARPASLDSLGRAVPGRFDTVLADVADGGDFTVQVLRICRMVLPLHTHR
ncbi:hypothetical protein FA95DRAFT_1577560 [Auriscalpium vulgare]|uniref:Uncharacterized protein n=1 Tax=Auriscalpium vulgare TaxID=40419 RepID=A0ACB8R6K6_9AGAM|nr:hypothetical protein FA95DRAFT_1577560 [Auriscalpium vulgare]